MSPMRGFFPPKERKARTSTIVPTAMTSVPAPRTMKSAR